MQQIARRCVAAAAVLTAGGLVAAVSSVTPSSPDVQVRDFDLAASLQTDLSSLIDAVENHFQPELSGIGDLGQPDISFGELFFDRGDDALSGSAVPTLNFSDLTLDQNLFSSLLGGGFAEALRDGLMVAPGAAGAADAFDGLNPGSLFGGNEQGASSAANAAALAAFSAVQGLPAAYQGFTDGVSAVELWYNNALVEAQEAAAEHLSGGNGTIDSAINWMFDVHNMMLGQNEDALNQVLGVSLSAPDVHDSLLTSFNPEDLSPAAWADLAGLTPSDFTAFANAADADNILILLGNIDWSGIFPGIF